MAELTAALEEREAWINLLYSRFKIEVALERQQAMFNALDRYASASNETSAGLYEKAIRRQLPTSAWAQIIHLATNHETRFYRNPAVIKLVASCARDFVRPRILSVGCSTGEEPYSLACELSTQGFGNYHVHGTDVSEPCIATAAAGIYRSNDAVLDRFATRFDGGSRMRFGWIKDFVTFEHHNILGELPIEFSAPNVIITQNMLIYYRTKTRSRILDRLSCLLADGGYLITAASEEGNWQPDGFERLPCPCASVFRKKP